MRDELQLGRLVSISGAQVIALLDADTSSSDDGPAVSVGSLVKMQTSQTHIYGMVTGQSIPIPSQDGDSAELKISELELVGEVPLPVGVHPGPGRRCHSDRREPGNQQDQAPIHAP